MTNNANINPVEFIRNKLNALADTFKAVNIKYAFNDIIHVHVVELTPVSEYYNNLALDNAWIPLSLEFESLYETDNIVFISSDSSLRILDAEMEWNSAKTTTINQSGCQLSEIVTCA
ncbi:hypothetical protein SAMN05428949_5459 [Chitinophaga sp. YR627]|uniref:hypothetical protein n=1 Tax=Chitinophaga sp. YR627 TaxID=1881041 RepID=UPI0008EB14B6|nr:hypothetical protein [Chitinophaga sp. YR627]SFO50322.1 hypothetical protein SAMN05428949_5459 [Chitinophaga sp. YR627]